MKTNKILGKNQLTAEMITNEGDKPEETFYQTITEI